MRRSPTITWREAVRDSDLDTTAKAVAFTLSTYMNGKAEAFPSKPKLAAGASLSKRAVDSGVATLELAGFLTIEKTKGRFSNRYRAAFPNHADVAPLTVQDVQGQPCRSAHPTVQMTTTNRAGAAPEVVVEIEREVVRQAINEECDICTKRPVYDTGTRLLCGHCLQEHKVAA